MNPSLLPPVCGCGCGCGWDFEKCDSLRDVERFVRRHHAVHNEVFVLKLKSSSRIPLPGTASCICMSLRLSLHRGLDLRLDHGGAADFDQLICVGKTLRGSIARSGRGDSGYIGQVMLYSVVLAVAIPRAWNTT